MNLRLAFCVIPVALVGQACLSSTPSSKSLYGPVAGPQTVKGSNVQEVSTRTVDHDQADTVEAITQAFNMLGFTFETRNDKTGLYTGGGNWNAPGQVTPCITPYTFAAYVKQIDSKPTSTLTVLIDRHSFCGAFGKPEKLLMNEVMANFTKVLLTF